MVNVDESFEVKFKSGKDEFQVLVDFDKLNEFKKCYANNIPNESQRVTAKPNEISVYDVLADSKIFKDQRKGEIASEHHLKAAFGAKSEEEILKTILLKGECQIPTSYLNKMRDEKKRQVINYIAENAINPATKGRYTISMIESEINKIRYNYNFEQDYAPQAEEVLKLLKKVMPISIERIVLEICVPARYCGNFYGPFKKFGSIKKEYYDNEGSFRIHIEITESQQDRVIDYIKKNSNNEASYHISKS